MTSSEYMCISYKTIINIKQMSLNISQVDFVVVEEVTLKATLKNPCDGIVSFEMDMPSTIHKIWVLFDLKD